MKPLIATIVFAIIMMLSSLFNRKKEQASLLAKTLSLLLVGVSVWELIYLQSNNIIADDPFGNAQYLFQPETAWLNVLIAALAYYFILISSTKIERIGKFVAEYYALIFFVIAGINLVSGFNNFLILFLGIELISIPQYIMAGSDKNNLKSSEASLKYFLMGAFSTGIMLMGIALIYGSTGTFYINVPEFNLFSADQVNMMGLVGMFMITIALGFKVSAAPMHFWAPDVYDGAPTPFASFMATISKLGVFIGFIRLFINAFTPISEYWAMFVAVIIVLTLVIGNITAVYQQSVKRMLAYSSIAHAGFMMFAILASNESGQKAIIIYTVAYCIATASLFGILMKLKDYTFDGFNGFAKQMPFLALVATICLGSLAGIPLTAGFFAKFYVLRAALEAHPEMVWLIIISLIFAAVSAYYYFKLIIAMYFKKATGDQTIEGLTIWEQIYYSIGAAALIIVGVAPDILFVL